MHLIAPRESLSIDYNFIVHPLYFNPAAIALITNAYKVNTAIALIFDVSSVFIVMLTSPVNTFA